MDRLLEVIGATFLDDQHGPLALAEIGDLAGHQRMRDVQHERRHPAFELEPVEAAHQHVGDAALDDDAEILAFTGKSSFSPFSTMKRWAAGWRTSTFTFSWA